MKVGAILPHVKRFGGVRRFIEVGNELVHRGYDYHLYVKDLGSPGFPFKGKLKAWKNINADVLLIGDPPSFSVLPQTKTQQTYIWVIASAERYQRVYAKYYSMHQYKFLINNRKFQSDYPDATLIEGGVNSKIFRRRKPLRIGYHAGRGREKGGHLVEESLKDLHGITLIPMKEIKSDGMLVKTYQSLDYYVHWEQSGGWANMAAEALACGTPVVSNGLVTEPFNDRVIVVKDLRKFFVNPMLEFSWKMVVEKLIQLWREDGVHVST
jgi:hypothetical protein